jgi:small subunit ribosomal protein S27e
MKRDELIPKAESLFMKVKCGKCGNEQIIFDRVSLEVRCNVCDEVLAIPRGGVIVGYEDVPAYAGKPFGKTVRPVVKEAEYGEEEKVEEYEHGKTGLKLLKRQFRESPDKLMRELQAGEDKGEWRRTLRFRIL